MSLGPMKRLGVVILPAIVLCAASAFLPSCGGGGGSDSAIIDAFGQNIDLYSEVPPLYVTGNLINTVPLKFYPKGSTSSGYADTDGDGVEDTKINDLQSFCNAANNIFREEIAACKPHGQTQRDLYDDPDIWNSINERPDTMPQDTFTTGTQYIQVQFPFKLSRASVFDPANPANSFMTGEITLRDELDNPVPCSVFLNGADANAVDWSADPNWPAGAKVNESTLVFIANDPNQIPNPGIPGTETAFTATAGNPTQWAQKEMRLRIGTLANDKGKSVTLDSKHLIRRSGLTVPDDDVTLSVVDILPSDIVYDPRDPSGGTPLVDPWPGVPLDESLVVESGVNFQIIFNKPVVPVTVGRSIVFNRAPFTGNMKPIPNPESGPNPDPACTGSVTPLTPNIGITCYFLDSTGNPVQSSQGLTFQTPIPFRVYPLHQNNMAKYIINPLIDLPGSTSDWVGLQGEPWNQSAVPDVDDLRMRIEITVYEYQTNDLTGLVAGQTERQNLCPAGFHGERFYNAGESVTKTFSILLGKRYVNAPVAPNVMYYTMGTSGIGAIDLCGNGFNTNAPGTNRTMWVTTTKLYSSTGNGMLNQGNDYAYPVGLGRWTPVPGINEGSNGWWNDLDPGRDALVRDSNGSARLFPDPDDKDLTYVNISDVEIGDFLDTIYFDKSNPYAEEQNHLDLIFTNAPGNFLNNMISSPPTPNPPPMTIPVGMRPVDVVLDEYSILQEGAFTIMGKEVFPPDLTFVPIVGPRQWVHLDPAGLTGGADQPHPPNPPGLGPWSPGSFIQDGPMAQTNTLGVSYSYAARQQIGNFLFAADKGNNRIRVLNSNSMDQIAVIQDGVRGPDNLAVSPDLRTLYVTNSAAANVSVYDVDPRSSNFLSLRAKVNVGIRPKGLCVQPDYEDVMVCNYGSNTISIINPATNTVRKTISALVKKPWDVVAAPRQNNFGWGTGVYHAYISNFGGNNVLIFESGPDGLGGVGYDDILDPVPSQGVNQQEFNKILRPRGLCYNPLYLNNGAGTTSLTGGVFVAHSSTKGAAVSRISFVDQYAPWGPVQITPISGSIGGTPGYGTRAFLIEAQWTAQDGYLSGFDDASDVALPDISRFAYIYQNFSGNSYVTNWGAVGNNPSQHLPTNNKHPCRVLNGAYTTTYFPDYMFVAHNSSKSIDVIEINTGDSTTITGLPKQASTLKTFFKN